jgi:hypothetical protein
MSEPERAEEAQRKPEVEEERDRLDRFLEVLFFGELNPIGMFVVWVMKPIERLIRWRPRSGGGRDRSAS